MELRIKPSQYNEYRYRALLIKGASPLLWFREIEAMNIGVDEVEAYAIPADKANVLYGCLLIFKENFPADYRSHKRFQCAYNKILLPENAALYPRLTRSDIADIKANWVIAHPDFGFVDLEIPIDWLDVLAPVPEIEKHIIQPAAGVRVPHQIKSFSIEMDESQLMASLEEPPKNPDWMKDLPFNLQKVLQGNKREVEKYLRYLEQYPEQALALGVPLDVMGASRSQGWGQFSFSNGWLGGLFGSAGGSNGSGGAFGWVGNLFGGGRDGGSSGSTYGSNRGADVSSRWVSVRYILLVGVLLTFMTRMFNREDRSYQFQLPGMMTPGHNGSHNPDRYKGMDTAVLRMVKEANAKNDSVSKLEQKKQQTFKKYAAASLEQANKGRKIPAAKRDSLRQEVNKLSQQLSEVNRQLQQQKISGAEYMMQQKIEASEAMSMDKIIDSFERVTSPKNQTSAAFIKFYEQQLNERRAQLKDSLEKQYSIASSRQEDIGNVNTMPATSGGEALANPDVSPGGMLALIAILMVSVVVYVKFIKQREVSFGGDGILLVVKLFLIAALLGILAYIFYPLVDRYGYNWAVWLLLPLVLILLYRLFSSDKTILKSDKDG